MKALEKSQAFISAVVGSWAGNPGCSRCVLLDERGEFVGTHGDTDRALFYRGGETTAGRNDVELLQAKGGAVVVL